LLFSALERRGARIVWVDDAVMYELVPESRARLDWILRRSYRTGVSRSITMIAQEDATWERRVLRVGRGVLEIGRGLRGAIVVRSAPKRVGHLRLAALGAGLIVGAAGFRYDEYATIHGH
jgi:hypothetical protein